MNSVPCSVILMKDYSGMYGDIRIWLDRKVEIPHWDKKVTKDGVTLLYGVSDIGVYSYRMVLGDGSVWSSRASVAGHFLEKKLVDVVINGTAAAIEVDDLKQLLPSYLKVVPYEAREGEVVHKVVPDEETEPYMSNRQRKIEISMYGKTHMFGRQ